MTETAQISDVFVRRLNLMHNYSACFVLYAQNNQKFVQPVSGMHTKRVFLNHLAQIVFNFVRLKELHLCS